MNRSETTAIYDSSQLGMPALEELKELWHFRNLLFQIIRRNIVVRYKRSVLGIAWTMLNPLGTTLILTIVFSNVFKGGPHYAVFVLSGLIAWTFFAQTSTDAMTNLIWGEGLIKRIYIPRTVFAVSAIGTGLVNVAFSIIPLLFVMFITRLAPQPIIFLLLIPVLFLSMFSLGVGLILSTIAIYFADMAQMYGILLTAWMYLSPVIYTIDMLPPRYVWIIKLNPMYYIINLFRMPIYNQTLPTLSELMIPALISIVTLLAGWFFFASKADEFAYRI